MHEFDYNYQSDKNSKIPCHMVNTINMCMYDVMYINNFRIMYYMCTTSDIIHVSHTHTHTHTIINYLMSCSLSNYQLGM